MSRLTFTRPASSWLESLPLGNGSLGVMVDGDDSVLRLDLNHDRGWSGGPASESAHGLPSAADCAEALGRARELIEIGDPVGAEEALGALQARYTQSFLPLGTLLVSRPLRGGAYRRTLDLGRGVHEVATSESSELMTVSHPHGVLLLASTESATVRFETPLVVIGERETADGWEWRLRFPSDVAPAHEPGFPAATWSDASGAAVEAVVRVEIGRSDSGGTLLLLAAETTRLGSGLPGISADEAAREVDRRIRGAAEAGEAEVLRQAVADHSGLFDRCRLSLRGGGEQSGSVDESSTEARLTAAFSTAAHPLDDDPRLAELLFDVGRYLLIASSRPGTLPATLQGIWNDSLQPPWSSNYTMNINLQMNYWAAHLTNLSETAETLRAFVGELAEHGTSTARRVYEMPGWVVHHNSDAWAFTNSVGDGHGDTRWSQWPMAGAWLSRSLVDAVEFGGGREEAERIWPIVAGAAEFVLAWHRRGPDGRWTTSPSTSPENAYVSAGGTVTSVDAMTAMDVQLVRDLLEGLLRLARFTGRDDTDLAQRARIRLGEIPEQPALAADGTIREWSADVEDAEPRHRHLSHLFGLYPGSGRWDEDSRAAAEATLTARGDDSTGWSLMWKTGLWARLRRADKIADLLALIFREAGEHRGPEAGGLYPNLFAAHPPFQIDANLAFPAVLAECLLQSHDGLVLLPAVPRQLDTGEIRGLVARPGIEVDLRWEAGSLVEARLRNRGPDPLALEVEWASVRIAVELVDEVLLGPAHFAT